MTRFDGDTMEARFERGRSATREHFPAGKASRAVRARQLLADALAQAPMNPRGMVEETCTGCGLERRAWLGNQGEGYAAIMSDIAARGARIAASAPVRGKCSIGQLLVAR